MFGRCYRLLASGMKTSFPGLPQSKAKIVKAPLIKYITPRFMTTKSDEVVSLTEQIKKRGNKRGKTVEDLNRKGYYNMAAFSTAEEYDLDGLQEALCQNQIFEVTPLGNELAHTDFIHARIVNERNCEPQEVFIFREGAFVTWNVRDIDIEVILELLAKYQSGAFAEDVIREECEVLSYTYTGAEETCMFDDDIKITMGANYDKFAISNATALSVKLGTWEATLANYVDTMEPITEDLKKGNAIKLNHKQVMSRAGELFALRHVVSLSSDLLDTPDAYWDHEKLEKVYHMMIQYFCINKRTRVINQKLSHSLEFVQLLADNVRDRYHVRLEWLIILLIFIEVVIELVHHFGNGESKDSNSKDDKAEGEGKQEKEKEKEKEGGKDKNKEEEGKAEDKKREEQK